MSLSKRNANLRTEGNEEPKAENNTGMETVTGAGEATAKQSLIESMLPMDLSPNGRPPAQRFESARNP